MQFVRHVAIVIAAVLCCVTARAQNPAPPAFNGLDTNMGNLYRLSNAETRSISPENPTGEKGKAGMATEGTGKGASRELGQGWKVSPSVRIKAGTTYTMADITGSGAIQQIWMTPAPLNKTQLYILRFYWDGETEPSVEVPMSHFFACGWGAYAQINSLPVCVNPGSAFNCYWNMPFHKKARITMENLDDKDMTLYFQVNYTLTDVPADAAMFHAQFRRVGKLPVKTDYTILDGVKGRGQYVGTYLAWEVRSPGWWGEGEIKFFMDGDKEFPTICGTGTEDYFCGSYNFENQLTKKYQTFSTPYTGLAQVLPPDIAYKPGQRFGLYRWHIADPIRFKDDLKVTIQALGWQSGGRYLPLEDDIASVAYWYQAEPHAKFPALPGKEQLIVGPLKVEVPKAP
ncbi:MAG: glycoside hydrolase family 172 protein [Tepidisphaerales bacterium]